MNTHPILTDALADRSADVLSFVANVERATVTEALTDDDLSAARIEDRARELLDRLTTVDDCHRICRTSPSLLALARTVRPYLDDDEWSAYEHALFELTFEVIDRTNRRRTAHRARQTGTTRELAIA